MSELEARVEKLEVEIAAIRERNLRVEADKAWETSTFRVALLCLLTYLVIAAVFWLIGVERYAANALVPTVGYYLSTRSVGIAKRWWIGKRR